MNECHITLTTKVTGRGQIYFVNRFVGADTPCWLLNVRDAAHRCRRKFLHANFAMTASGSAMRRGWGKAASMNAACLPTILFSPASAMTARSRRHSTAVRSVMKNGEESMACRKMPVERTSILALKCLSIFCDDGLPPPPAGRGNRHELERTSCLWRRFHERGQHDF